MFYNKILGQFICATTSCKECIKMHRVILGSLVLKFYEVKVLITS